MNIEELKSLVSEFRTQGVSDEEIRKTLLEMSVDESIVNELLGGGPEEASEATNNISEPEGTQPQESVPSLPEEPPETPEIEILPKMETHEKVEELHRKVDRLYQVAAKGEDLVAIKERLVDLDRDLREVKSTLKAIQKLLQEVLNTERSILVDLYERSKNCK